MINNICIFLDNEHRGFLISIGILLGRKNNSKITYVIKDSSINKILDQDSNPTKKVIDYSLLEVENNNERVIDLAIEIEKKYNVRLNDLIAQDRGLGQGYLFNAQKHPYNYKSDFTKNKKYKEIINEIKKNEKILNNFDLIIQHLPNKLKTMVAKNRKLRILSIVPIKYGDNCIWSDNDYFSNSIIKKEIIKNVKNHQKNKKEILFKEWFHSINSLKDHENYLYKNMFKNIFKTFFGELKKLLKNEYNKNSYILFGWLPTTIRKIINYKYVKSVSKTIDELSGGKYIYFPLHLEPEIALLWFSPEFNNSMEAISWISKSLPADVLLIIKEQGHSFSIRQKSYYKQLNKLANVYWANPDTHSWDWIKNSNAVATFTGTAGIEAIYMEKPVISFGKHQLINYLPTAFYVSNFNETSNSIKKIFSKNFINESILNKSKIALYKTQIENSFELINYKINYKEDSIDLESADIAIKNLFYYITKN